jgi:GTP-binding protein EngB required for normal cell division
MASTPIENGIGLETAARNIKELVDTLEQLRHIGLKSIETHLPELIMVGDQSAGKSSMMSAIAEINLPRGHSMCTRCPTNIKTSDAPVWSCKIELHEQYTWDPVVRKRTQKFQNWVEREEGLVVKDFASVKHKRDLEEVLKWAQLALLNPSEDCGSFIPGTDGHARQRQKRKDNPNHKEQAKFSPNVISIEILGPNLPPLSFYDLPGLFQDAEDADQEYLIKVFEDLTVKYIKHEKALIICAINMAIDPGLSRTKNVITAKKAKDRCIGVLTMPDRLQQHETVHKDYDNIFHKRTYVLPHGYFVTKQPGPEFGHHDDPDYHIIARQEEEEFFDSGSFWSKGREWEEFRSRCGTGTILKYLSEEFAKLILSRYYYR